MFSITQKISFFESFVARNAAQISLKARTFSLGNDEIKSELFILISEKLCKFDPALGSAEAFFFSRLHASLSRFNRDACCNAISLNGDPERDVSLLAEVENKADQTAHAAVCFTRTYDKGIVPGAADLSSLAEAASGKTAVNPNRSDGKRKNALLQPSSVPGARWYSAP
jgi:hypothetical protein